MSDLSRLSYWTYMPLGSGDGHCQDLDVFFRRYHALLIRLCARWTRGHRADAQDLLAEAYLRALQARKRTGVLPDNLIAWVSSIITNLARDRLRAQTRGPGALDDRGDLDALCDPRCASDTLFATRELLTQTLVQVRRLCPLQRGALLARSAGEDYAAIAAHFGTSPVNARKLVQTARSELRARLSPHAVTPAPQKTRHSAPQPRPRVPTSPTRP